MQKGKFLLFFLSAVLMSTMFVCISNLNNIGLTGTTKTEYPQVSDYTGYGTGDGGAYLVTPQQTYFNGTDRTIADASDFDFFFNGITGWNATSITIGIKEVEEDSTPGMPTDSDLEINNTDVTDGANGYNGGSWTSTTEINCTQGHFHFEMTADALTECKIDNVTIVFHTHSYEESVPLMGSTQTIWIIGKTITFNMSFYYTNRRMNFTVPYNWGSYQCFDDLVNVTANKTETKIGSYDLVTYPGATSGSWSFRGYSSNLMSKVENFDADSDEEIYTTLVTNIVYFMSTFSVKVTGAATIEVYNPSAEDNDLVFDGSTTQLSSSLTITFTDWDINNNVTDVRGYFRVCCYWNNETHGGYAETTLRIYDAVDTDEDVPEELDSEAEVDTGAELLYYVAIGVVASAGVIGGLLFLRFKTHKFGRKYK